MLARRLVAGLAAGSLANAMQMLVFSLEGRALSTPLFVDHWLLVAALHVLGAALLAGSLENRLWSAVVFLFPVTTSVAPILQSLLGTAGLLGTLAGALAFGAIWALLLPRRGAPFVAAAAGAAAGGFIPFLQNLGHDRGIDGAIVLSVATLATAIATLISLLAGRRRGPLLPPVSRSLVPLALAAGIALAAFFLTPPDALPDSPPASAEQTGPSVVLIVLDTVRADHLELYGYERETMPNLTLFARTEGVVAKRGIANGPSSLPSHASLFTGLYPPHHGAHKPYLDDPEPPVYAYPLDPSIPTLATILSGAGYWTVGICANSGALSPAFGLGQGFDVYSALPSARYEVMRRSPWGILNISSVWLERLLMGASAALPFSDEFLLGVPYKRAADITDEAIAVLDAAGDRPLFLFLNYLDAHAPYFPPGEYLDRHPGRSSSMLLSRIDRDMMDAVLSGEREITDEERAHLTALYDGELSYLDGELERLLERLRRHPRWDEMLVIITSDHGEAFGEHAGLEHSISLYDEITRVPLIVKPGSRTPGAPPAGSVIARPLQSVDAFPLVLSHAGVRAPDRIDGRAWGAGRTHAFGWLYPHRSDRPYSAQELRSVQNAEGWKLVRSSSGDVELYDLAGDRAELTNRADAHPEIRRELLGALDRTGLGVRRARRVPAPNRDTLEQLRTLGYLP